MHKSLRINADRFQQNFQALSRIGASASGGLNRPALSEPHLAARQWLSERIRAAGLAFSMDGAGNHIGRLACGPVANAPALLLGSHLDSVPGGGRFDGALGVAAGLEVLHTIADSGLRLPFNLEVIDFTDEEGTLVSFLGSFAFCGKLTREEMENPRSGKEAFQAGLQRAGLTPEGILAARRDPSSVAGYLELHIEQGKQLEKHGRQAGLVTAIAGIKFFRLVYSGRAEHAGTADMEDRLDASQAASAFTLFARQVILEQFPGCFANVGQAHYEPGAFNIVPGRATLSCEFRAPDLDRFHALEHSLFEQAAQEGRRFGLETQITVLGERKPVQTHPLARQAILESLEGLGLSWMEIVSRAGHDAQPMAGFCPSGMVFIPSIGGISHSPHEDTNWQDCVNGANVLLHSALHFAERLSQHS